MSAKTESENVPGLTLALLRQIRRENALFRSEMIARHTALREEIEIATGRANEYCEMAGDFLTRAEKRSVALNERMRRIEARLPEVQGSAGNVSQFKRRAGTY